jgi:hypothetical protein
LHLDILWSHTSFKKTIYVTCVKETLFFGAYWRYVVTPWAVDAAGSWVMADASQGPVPEPKWRIIKSTLTVHVLTCQYERDHSTNTTKIELTIQRGAPRQKKKNRGELEQPTKMHGSLRLPGINRRSLSVITKKVLVVKGG